MKLQLTKSDKRRLLVVAAVFLGLSVGGWFLVGGLAYSLMGTFALLVILTVQLQMWHKMEYMIKRGHDVQFEQVEALVSLHFSLAHVRPPLPATRGWAASPDFLKEIATLIYRKQPALILEMGSGVSTVISGYCLQQVGAGRIIALDHEKKYADKTEADVRLRGLQDTCEVRYAPLTACETKGWKGEWYDVRALDGLDRIDMVIVDGPPEFMQEMARYPALPLLFEKLNDDAVLLMDDGNREGEKQTVERWVDEYPGLEAEYRPFEKGGFLIRKSGKRAGVRGKG